MLRAPLEFRESCQPTAFIKCLCSVSGFAAGFRLSSAIGSTGTAPTAALQHSADVMGDYVTESDVITF